MTMYREAIRFQQKSLCDIEFTEHKVFRAMEPRPPSVEVTEIRIHHVAD